MGIALLSRPDCDFDVGGTDGRPILFKCIYPSRTIFLMATSMLATLVIAHVFDLVLYKLEKPSPAVVAIFCKAILR